MLLEKETQLAQDRVRCLFRGAGVGDRDGGTAALYKASPIQAIVHLRQGSGGCHSCRFCRSRVALAISVVSGIAGYRFVDMSASHITSDALLVGEIL
jgi:Fe-S cluster biogenesis protein NfuA